MSATTSAIETSFTAKALVRYVLCSRPSLIRFSMAPRKPKSAGIAIMPRSA